MTKNKLPHIKIPKNFNLIQLNRTWYDYDITDDDISNDHRLNAFKNDKEFHNISINKSKTKLRIEDDFGDGLIYDIKNKKIIEQYLGY